MEYPWAGWRDLPGSLGLELAISHPMRPVIWTPPPANRAMSGAGEGVGVELSPHRDCSQSPGRRRRVLNPRYNQSSLQTSCTGTGREDSGTKWCWSRRIAFFKHSPVFVVLPSAGSHCGSDARFALQGCTGALVLGGKNKEN